MPPWPPEPVREDRRRGRRWPSARRSELSAPASDLGDWARAHGACFEVEPLTELVRGRPVQVGFTVSLYARLPLDAPPQQRWVQAAEIRARLRELLQSLAPPANSPARLEMEPFRRAAFMTPEGGMEPEIAVCARVFHGADYFAEVTEAEERKVYQGARRLREMGLTERRRRIP